MSPEQALETENLADESTDDIESSETEGQEDIDDAGDGDSQDDESSNDTDTSDDESADDGLDTEDFGEWRSDHELPDGIDSPETLATSYKESLAETKRLQSQVHALQTASVEQPTQQPPSSQPPLPAVGQPAQGESYFANSPAKTFIAQMIEDGRVRDEAGSTTNTASYRSLATTLDGILNPILQRVEAAMQGIGNMAASNRQSIRDSSWSQLPEATRTAFKQEDVDRLLDSQLVKNYDEAIRYLAFNKPELLGKLTKNAENRGAKKERHGRKRFKAIRKGGSKSIPSIDFKYLRTADSGGVLNDGWNERRLNRVGSLEKQIAIIEAFEKTQKG